MNFHKLFWGVIISIILMLLQVPCDASQKGTVNVLTRYKYLRSPQIASIVKNECGVEISYDEYYGGSECFRRISTAGDFYHYDIVIFPNNMYKLISRKIVRKNSSLNSVVKEYSSIVKDHYLSHDYPANVVYFTLSLSGFIWNPSIINLSTADSIVSMFEKAKNNTVILSESRTGVWNLIDNKQKLPRGSLATAFMGTIKDADVYITNGYNKLYSKDSFAFAFQRSGDAVFIIRSLQNRGLAFFAHPDYSYGSFDMMAELNAKPETLCVAKVLASRRVLDIVQKETYYLSPYGTYKSVNDPVFRNVYRQVFDNTYQMRWLDPFFLDATRSNELRDMWDEINVVPHVMKNRSLVLKRKPD